MVFYRKYRPQNFEELIGQEHVKTTLLNAFKAGKLGHAYLFTGPRGSGKTSTARILAKIVNCEEVSKVSNVPKVPRGEKTEVGAEALDTLGTPDTLDTSNEIPCNKCSSCLSITDGSNLDLIEIDAASNRGIDDIRELREKIKLAPSSAKKKVYIIDEVHMLTTEAFNALLKTLEEPPAHALFILATTEVQKLPATILSRVQRFDFKLASMDEVKTALKNIAEKEGLAPGDEVLSLVAEISEGSFRDAVKLLDQVASSGETDLAKVQGLLKANDFSEISGLIEKIASSDSKGALLLIQEVYKRGANIKEFTNSVQKALREILLIKSGAGELIAKDSGNKFKVLEALSQKMELSKLIQTIENLNKSLEQLKYTSLVSLPLEVAVIKSAQNIQTHVIARSEATRQSQLDQSVKLANESHNVSPASQGFAAPSARNDEGGRKEVVMGGDLVESPQSEQIPSVETMQSTDDVVIITDKWTYILETIKPYNFSLEALLRQTKVKNCDGVNVILEVPYSFHQRILEAPKSRTLLESVLADVLGKSVKVTTVIGKREVKASELANVEVAQDDEIVRLAAEIFNS